MLSIYADIENLYVDLRDFMGNLTERGAKRKRGVDAFTY